MKERYTPNADKACDELLFVPYNYSAAKWSIWWLCLLCKKKNAKHCNVKCYNEQYTVKDILIGDRIQLETSNEAIREEFLKHYGNLEDLLRKGRITESRIQAKLF